MVVTERCDCGRQFLAFDTEPERQCAVCKAYDGKRGTELDATSRDEAVLQRWSDISLVLQELVDLIHRAQRLNRSGSA